MIAENLAGGNGTLKALRTQVAQEQWILFKKGDLKNRVQSHKPVESGLLVFNGSIVNCLENKSIHPVIRL